MLKVLFSGPVFENTGFSWGCRSYMEILKTLPIDLYLIPIDVYQPPAADKDISRFSSYACRPFRDLVKANKTEPDYVDVCIMHRSLFDSEGDARKDLPKKADRMIYAPNWECPLYPNWFIDAHPENVFNEFIAPCEYVSRCNNPVKFTGTLNYYHQPVDRTIKAEKDDGQVVFYSIAHYVARKNINQMIRCFCKAFTAKDKVELVYKMGDQEDPNYARHRSNMLREITSNFPDPPKISVLWGRVSDAEMEALHRCGDVFYQLQHSEGWGIPHVEALMYGNPLVTNTYGAVGEYTSDENSFIIPHEERNVRESLDSWNLDPSAGFFAKEAGEFSWGYVEDEDVVESLHSARLNYKSKRNKGPAIDLSFEKCTENWSRFLGL